jgi:hypothetical protein
VLPTIRAWDVGLRRGVRVDATTESVGDGVAARYAFPPGAAGRIVHERTKVDEEARAKYEGLSFWVKGDGSAAKGLVTFGDHKVEASAPFDLPREWTKVFVPWERFEPAIRGDVRHLGFSIQPGGAGERSYLIDRLRLYTTPLTERIEPTPPRDASGGFPAESYLAGRESLTTILELLESRRPATILFTGDSVTAGAQIYYTVPPERGQLDWERKWCAGHLFGLRAGAAVAKRRGYARSAYRFERWDFRAKEWVHVLRSAAELKPELNLAPWPSENDRLRTIVYGAGGQESRFAAEHADEMLAHQPDLVVYQFAGNDLYNKRDVEAYFGRYLAELVRACRSAGAEVALLTPPPLLSFSDRRLFVEGEAWAEHIRGFAAENGCALVDVRRAFLARGLHHAGDLYSDFAHPNHRGHRLLARLVEELLAPSGLAIWDDLP